MPRVKLNRIQEKPKVFAKWLIGEMLEKNLYQKDIALWLGISQQAVGKKLREFNFTYIEMLTIFDELGTEKEEQIRVIL